MPLQYQAPAGGVAAGEDEIADRFPPFAAAPRDGEPGGLKVPDRDARYPDPVSRVPRGFPDDFLAGADYIHGGMSARLDLPPGRSRHG